MRSGTLDVFVVVRDLTFTCCRLPSTAEEQHGIQSTAAPVPARRSLKLATSQGHTTCHHDVVQRSLAAFCAVLAVVGRHGLQAWPLPAGEQGSRQAHNL